MCNIKAVITVLFSIIMMMRLYSNGILDYDVVDSFIVVKMPKLGAAATSGSSSIVTLFIYSCPENVPVRQKMTMSSSKASVLGAAGNFGLVPDK